MSKPTVCLITPPSEFLLDERVFVSLGILKVGAVLKQAGYRVDHLDLSGVKNYEEVVRVYANSNANACRDTRYAITATSPQMPAAYQIARVCRRPFTILGGPHATLTNAAARTGSDRAIRSLQTLRNRFGVVVAGDGEKAIFQSLEAQVGSVIDADSSKSPLWISSAENNVWPARELVDIESYNYSVDGERALSLIGQLGCPFKCTFCAGRASPMLRQIRLRDSADVVGEMKQLYSLYGVKGFMFLDDELNVNRQFTDLLMRIIEAGADLGVEWRLRGFLKSELFTEEQAELMYRAGFRQLLIGFEAGDERILANIQKNATVADNTRCMEIAKKYGLKVKALMSIGHAGETLKSVYAVRQWLLDVGPDDFDVTVITPYPGSPYYDKAVEVEPGVYCYTDSKNGDRLYMDDVDFTKDAAYYKGAPGDYISHVWTDELSREEIVRLRDWVEAEVRHNLKLPFYRTGASLQFESSMGMTKIPSHILRSAS